MAHLIYLATCALFCSTCRTHWISPAERLAAVSFHVWRCLSFRLHVCTKYHMYAISCYTSNSWVSTTSKQNTEIIEWFPVPLIRASFVFIFVVWVVRHIFYLSFLQPSLEDIFSVLLAGAMYLPTLASIHLGFSFFLLENLSELEPC